jgi:hypothetical protein
MTNVNFIHFKFLPMSMRVLFSMVLLVFGIERERNRPGALHPRRRLIRHRL